jgi:drug/metabolite transporter (DMT)-like permease
MHVKASEARRSSALTALCLLTVWVAWGGTYPAIRVMVETVPPLLGTAVRFLLAGAVLAAVLGALGRLRAARREVAGAAVVGTVILGDIGVLAVAEQEVPAGLAALIIASVPLWIVLLQLGAREPVAPPHRGRRARRPGRHRPARLPGR